MNFALVNRISTKWNDVLIWMTKSCHNTLVLSCVRIGIGAVTLLMLLVNFNVRGRIWGADSTYHWDLFAEAAREYGQPSLLLLSNNPIFFEIFYLSLIMASLTFTFGFGGRYTTIIFFVLLWSLHVRNPMVTNGGDNLVRIILIYMFFAKANEYLSVDKILKLNRKTSTYPKLKIIETVAHNSAVIACTLQVAILYFASGLFKVQGEKWQNGTAVYYVTRTAEYNLWPDLTLQIFQSPVIVVIATYSALFIQLLLPFSIINSTIKRLLIPAVMMMHIGIGVLMGLPFFSGYMIIADLLFLTDADLSNIRIRFTNFIRKHFGCKSSIDDSIGEFYDVH